MDKEMEEELINLRKGLEDEIQTGNIPKIDVENVIYNVRKGIKDIKDGNGVLAENVFAKLKTRYAKKEA